MCIYYVYICLYICVFCCPVWFSLGLTTCMVLAIHGCWIFEYLKYIYISIMYIYAYMCILLPLYDLPWELTPTWFQLYIAVGILTISNTYIYVSITCTYAYICVFCCHCIISTGNHQLHGPCVIHHGTHPLHGFSYP